MLLKITLGIHPLLGLRWSTSNGRKVPRATVDDLNSREEPSDPFILLAMSVARRRDIVTVASVPL